MNRPLTILITTLLLIPAQSWAQGPYIELDLDGTLGNGPDHEIAQIGDTLLIDAWVMPAVPLLFYFHVGFALRGINASLESWTHLLGWTAPPAVDMGDERWYVEATTFSFIGYVPPYLFGRAEYLYHGPGPGRVRVEEPTEYLDDYFQTGQFTNNIPARFGPTTATESSSWSQVKELFR